MLRFRKIVRSRRAQVEALRVAAVSALVGTWWVVDRVVEREADRLLVFAGAELLLVLSFFAIAALAQRMRRRSRRSFAKCDRCGYDLRATPYRCPECGYCPPEPTSWVARLPDPNERAWHVRW